MATLVDDSTSPDEPDPSLILMLTASNLPSSWHWSQPLHDLQQILTPHMYTHTHTHRIFEPWLMYLHSSSGPALSNDFWMIAWWVNAEWICEGIKKKKQNHQSVHPPINELGEVKFSSVNFAQSYHPYWVFVFVFLNVYLFIWLHWVFVAAHKIFVEDEGPLVMARWI